MPFDGATYPGITTVAVLRRAADILKRDGWCRGELHKAGRHCLMGAVYAATEEIEQESGVTLWNALHLQMKAEAALGFGSMAALMYWNDLPWRTAKQAIKRLQLAATREMEHAV